LKICYLFIVWLRQALCTMISEVWDRHNGTLCVGIDWELFRDQDHALASCFIVVVLVSIS